MGSNKVLSPALFEALVNGMGSLIRSWAAHGREEWHDKLAIMLREVLQPQQENISETIQAITGVAHESSGCPARDSAQLVASCALQVEAAAAEGAAVEV